MTAPGSHAPAPVSPATIEVGDLTATCRAFGLDPPPTGTRTIEVEFLPGCVASLTEVDGPATDFVYMCTADLAAARRSAEARFGSVQQGPDTVDPDTLRLRGCLLRTDSLLVDAVHCPRAETTGVPCGDDCSPSLSFE